MSGKTLHLQDVNLARVVFGERDRHLALVEKLCRVEILARGTDLVFKGKAEACRSARHLLASLYGLASQGYPLGFRDVEQAAKILLNNPDQDLAEIFLDSIVWSTRNQSVGPRTLIQKAYVEAIRRHDIVFGWGPAGTGKTYLAMAMAVAALNSKEVDHIILTRPAVEAGEKLGFLPGDLAEKVNPYLRPLYDALHDMMNFEKAQRLVSTGTIEVAPLAFMRGRTLNHSFVILDEAQNTTREQMKMFLTRLGFDSKAVITGDVTQVDLPEGKNSGLTHALKVLSEIGGIAFVEFSEADIVRHPLVSRIVHAYEAAQKQK